MLLRTAAAPPFVLRHLATGSVALPSTERNSLDQALRQFISSRVSNCKATCSLLPIMRFFFGLSDRGICIRHRYPFLIWLTTFVADQRVDFELIVGMAISSSEPRDPFLLRCASQSNFDLPLVRGVYPCMLRIFTRDIPVPNYRPLRFVHCVPDEMFSEAHGRFARLQHRYPVLRPEVSTSPTI